MLLPYAGLLVLGMGHGLALCALPLALILVWQFFHTPPSPVFNRLLAMSAGLQLVFSLLLSLDLTIF